MFYHDKNHRQAMGAVMSHLGARVLRVLKEDRPYDIRNLEGKSIDKNEAKGLILHQYHVLCRSWPPPENKASVGELKGQRGG
jgi:hypothetical protein